jgi:integrase
LISRSRVTLWDLFELHFRPQNLELGEAAANQYRTTLRKLDAWRSPLYADELDRELVLGFLRELVDKGLARGTVNSKRAQVMALWRYAFDQGYTPEAPSRIAKLKEPKQQPQAWTTEEVERLIAACRRIPGKMRNGVSRANWWECLVCVCYYTGLRIGAVLLLRWDWVADDGRLEVPFGVIKELADRREKLPLWLVRKLYAIRVDEFLLPWPYDRTVLWKQWRRRVVGPSGVRAPKRKCGFHRLRKTFASYLDKAQPGSAAAWLHEDPKVTRERYVDRSISIDYHPSDLLPPVGKPDDPQARMF